MHSRKFAQGSTDWCSLAKMMILISVLCLVPLLVIPFYPQDRSYLPAFAIPSGLSAAAGILVGALCSRKASASDRVWEGRPAIVRRSALIVISCWLWAILIGGLPFFLSGQLRIIPSLFEATSGWTTTGLSAMDVSQTPAIFLFHRSFMQYCGGLGFVMMMVILTSGKHDIQLFESEGHPDLLMPGLKKQQGRFFCCFLFFSSWERLPWSCAA